MNVLLQLAKKLFSIFFLKQEAGMEDAFDLFKAQIKIHNPVATYVVLIEDRYHDDKHDIGDMSTYRYSFQFSFPAGKKRFYYSEEVTYGFWVPDGGAKSGDVAMVIAYMVAFERAWQLTKEIPTLGVFFLNAKGEPLAEDSLKEGINYYTENGRIESMRRKQANLSCNFWFE